MYYWALCLSTSLKLISLLSKKAWQSNLCIITPIWESPRGPDTKKYGSCTEILSGSWYMSFPGFWYKTTGVLIQNHRGADTKPPGCWYKNYRGPLPGVSGIQPIDPKTTRPPSKKKNAACPYTYVPKNLVHFSDETTYQNYVIQLDKLATFGECFLPIYIHYFKH